MIERYFVKGARYSWAAPSAITTQPKDGAIVVTPVVTAPMFYVGLDAEIVDHSLPNVSTLGFRKDMGISYKWLSYIHGRTAKISPGATDVLTGFMSGCRIATWTDNGGRWVGHVGTVESAPKDQPPNSTVKNAFVQAMPQNVLGYNPAGAFDASDFMLMLRTVQGKPSAQVLSLVTSNNVFYSILMVERMDERGIWICAGKKQVPAVAYDALSRELLTTRPRR
jgi:hypothetical protein